MWNFSDDFHSHENRNDKDRQTGDQHGIFMIISRVAAISDSVVNGQLNFGHIKNELLDVLDEDANFTDEMKNSIYDAFEPEG